MSLSLRAVLFAAVPASVVVLAALACDKPLKPGAVCPTEVSPGMAFCYDSSTALMCGPDKKFANDVIPCKGPKGCFGTRPGDLSSVCDFSRDVAGDYCVTADAVHCDVTSRACSSDGNSMVVCNCTKPAKFEVIPCRGPKACSLSAAPSSSNASSVTASAGKAVCDHTQVKPGDSCDAKIDPHTYACSADAESMFVCAPNHTWTVARSCKGPKHCVDHSGTVDCDSIVADVGDPCDVEGMMGCSVDRGSATQCKHGIFVEAARCKGPNFCQDVPLGNTFRVDCDGLGQRSPTTGQMLDGGPTR